MTAKRQSAYFLRILIGIEKNIVSSVPYLIDTGAQPDLTSKDIMVTDWLSNVQEENQTLLLSSSKK